MREQPWHPELRACFVQSACANGYDTQFQTLTDPIRHRQDLVAALDQRLQLNTPDTLTQRSAYFQVAGTTPDDYRERLLVLGPGRPILAGIRFVGLDVTRPFVDVLPGFCLEAPHELDEICAGVRTVFQAFQPRHLTLWLRPDHPFLLQLDDGVAPHALVMAGTVPEVLEASDAIPSRQIRLLEPTDTTYFPWYQAHHRRFQRLSPDLKPWVMANDLEELEHCRSQGLLRQVRVDGVPGGLIAASSRALLGRSGLYFYEMLLTAPFRGLGLAVPAQRAFIRAVGRPFALVWGTIDAHNRPSRRTAERVGRRVVRVEAFIRL